jgi:hypothetical protein
VRIEEYGLWFEGDNCLGFTYRVCQACITPERKKRTMKMIGATLLGA